MNADLHALLGPYVLDAVDDLERASFERHLAGCPVCQGDVDELREASAHLSGDAWSVPPPSMRTGVMTAISTVRQISPAAPPATRSPRTRLRLLSAAAALVLVAGGAVYAVQERRVRAEHATAVEAGRISALLAAPDLAVRQEPVTGGGTVTVAVSKQRNAGVITLAADAAPSDGRVFELWTIRNKVPIAESTLTPGQTTTMRIVEGISAASDVGVSIEPPGGSPTPTMPLAAAVNLA
jgi:anti-sigma factor RsiW